MPRADVPLTARFPRDEQRVPLTAILVVFGISLTAILGAFGVLLLGGAEVVDRTPEFIPSVDVAKSALTLAMDAWKDGAPTGAVPGTKPVVRISDSRRKSDQSLISYEILGEVPGNAPRTFAVKVRLLVPQGRYLEEPPVEKEERLRFIIVGIDPLWIFSQVDYDLICHSEHPMAEKKPREEPSKDQPSKP